MSWRNCFRQRKGEDNLPNIPIQVSPPSHNTSSCIAGGEANDADYHYCVAHNAYKRIGSRIDSGGFQ